MSLEGKTSRLGRLESQGQQCGLALGIRNESLAGLAGAGVCAMPACLSPHFLASCPLGRMPSELCLPPPHDVPSFLLCLSPRLPQSELLTLGGRGLFSRSPCDL